jgi:uncharacterized protein YlzI (FlbEa/FlbD family)
LNFINLTRHDGQHILVNAYKIEALIPYEGFTAVIFTGGNSIDVRETDKEILTLLNNQRW